MGNVGANMDLGQPHHKAGNLIEGLQTRGRALRLDATHSLARISLTQATASGISVE